MQDLNNDGLNLRANKQTTWRIKNERPWDLDWQNEQRRHILSLSCVEAATQQETEVSCWSFRSQVCGKVV